MPGRKTAPGPINVTIGEPESLFQHLDPSPLIGRDLDDEVESYILESAHELPKLSYALNVHVPAEQVPTNNDAADLSDAIRAYFAYRRDQAIVRLRRLFREARGALVVGFAFLFVCGAAGALIERAWPGPLGSFLNEGLVIIGWVALWRPLEMLLYDWRPIRRERLILAGLAEMPVRFIATGTSL